MNGKIADVQKLLMQNPAWSLCVVCVTMYIKARLNSHSPWLSRWVVPLLGLTGPIARSGLKSYVTTLMIRWARSLKPDISKIYSSYLMLRNYLFHQLATFVLNVSNHKILQFCFQDQQHVCMSATFFRFQQLVLHHNFRPNILIF